jgi:DNA-directed RNA polymerase subunit beta'
MGGGTSEEKDAESATALTDLSKQIAIQTLKTKIGQGSTLAKMVVSEARGKPSQLAQMVSSPVMFTDLKQRPILLPIRSSFAEGLKPDEYWASSYGARLGVISSKFATADAGAFGKQMAQATLGLVVTMVDCGTSAGIPSTVDDNDNLDAFLAAKAGSFSRNTLITPSVLAELKRENVTDILVRSPITCEAPKGVCAKCRGLNDKNKLPALGENIGLASASAMAEPVTQMSLNVKHSGGAAGQGGIASGYKLLNQLTSVPSEFPNRAAISTRTGKVTKIEPAPQGGTFTFVDGETHYSLPGFRPSVKVGDSVEEGDPLDGAIVNPAETVVFKGVGEGRRQLVNKLRDAYKDAGAAVGRRHFEVLSRALINQAQIDTDILPGSLPDDIVDFQALQKEYRAPTSRTSGVEGALGKYLTKPVLHYTVGTKLFPSMVQELRKFGIKSVEVEDAPPPFTPMMLRMQDIPQIGSDWMSALYSRNLKVNLLKNVHRGAKAPTHSTSFIPSLAEGTEFGRSPKGPPEY